MKEPGAAESDGLEMLYSLRKEQKYSYMLLEFRNIYIPTRQTIEVRHKHRARPLLGIDLAMATVNCVYETFSCKY